MNKYSLIIFFVFLSSVVFADPSGVPELKKAMIFIALIISVIFIAAALLIGSLVFKFLNYRFKQRKKNMFLSFIGALGAGSFVFVIHGVGDLTYSYGYKALIILAAFAGAIFGYMLTPKKKTSESEINSNHLSKDSSPPNEDIFLTMKNKSLSISDQWKVMRDEFYDLNPFDTTTDIETEFLYQEDLLWIQKEEYNIDLGWYERDDCFRLYLYKGKSWHECQLLEKIQTKKHTDIITALNAITNKVVSGDYEEFNQTEESIDDFTDFTQYSLVHITDGRERLKNGQHSVGHAECTTGHVLTIDKEIYFQKGTIYLNFSSKKEGIEYMEKFINENPDIECWMLDSFGEHVITIDQNGERNHSKN
ncbi:MAG: hypothetical protein MK066_12515 [Crocinitomicaceae bacterium]|nr:hypothetical protein [Crocinitomicaceae bacterium]